MCIRDRTNAETESASYLPKGKAYELQTWYTDGARRPLSPTSAVTSKIKGQGRNVVWQVLGHKSRTKSPINTNISRKVAHPTDNNAHQFQSQKVKGKVASKLMSYSCQRNVVNVKPFNRCNVFVVLMNFILLSVFQPNESIHWERTYGIYALSAMCCNTLCISDLTTKQLHVCRSVLKCKCG